MSLLMDALKKAEQAKQQGSSTAADGAMAAPAPDPLVGLGNEQPADSPARPPLKLEELDAEFIAHARGDAAGTSPRPMVDRRSEPAPRTDRLPPRPAPPPKQTPAADTAARAAVHNVFAAKQPDAGPANRTFLLAVGALGLLAVAAIGIYFWLQLRPVAGITRPGLTAAAPASPISLPPPDAAPPPAAAGLVPPTAPAARPEPAPTPVPKAVATVRHQPPPTSDIRIARNRAATNPSLQQGYDALQSGDLGAARTAYGRVLESEPRNIDALQGLAAVAMAEGRSGDAAGYFLRILEADPRDGAALAGLVALNGQSDPVAGESRLKSALAAQPDLPVLHFALGNLYARQNRWSEAQQSYFKACSGSPDNPDFLFNLAVSLDQLHQTFPAAQYYQKALAAAAGRPAGFDRNQATARLRELQP
jgi:Tfp pilus assembly protein PilF